MSYSLQVFIPDTSALKNRSLILAFYNSPYIATARIDGPLAAAFLAGSGWIWSFGVSAIVTPVVSLPLIALFSWNFRKAKALDLMPVKKSDHTLAQSSRLSFVLVVFVLYEKFVAPV